MTPERWLRLEELFDAAVELEPEQREVYLDRACADDTALRRQVESLIVSSEDADQLIEGAIQDAAARAAEIEATTVAGQHIGPYMVDRELGRGGMGAVYLARRADDEYQKQVAIKLIKGGIATPDLLRRFRSERQILANLDHPNIARLLDGGTTDSGTPYVVMEYVDGEPIDEYCDRNRLPTEDRLVLFRKVCSAVHYAHQNLVVHRDVKPGNIMVTADGEPKLLDFGIAKLLKSDEPLATIAETKAEVRLMTPEYASPEQVRGEAITTASDIYSLGVVLYELLAGHRPHRFKSRQPAEIERVICEQEPDRPSTAITRDEQEAATDDDQVKITADTVGERRRSTTEKLKRRLRGDLDNIVLMAMRKEPTRRYPSVEQFSEDIHRHLEGLPVLARPATVRYRAGKFVRRHSVGVAAAAAVALLIAALVGFYTWRLASERDRAQLEAAKASKVSEFLTGLFEVSDPSQSKGETITARELLDRGAAKIESELAGQPEVRAKMTAVMGDVFNSFGLPERARPLVEESLKLRRELHGQQHLEVVESLDLLAEVERLEGSFDAAESAFREALAIRRSLLGEDHPDVAHTLEMLAQITYEKGDYTSAEQLLRQALAIFEKQPTQTDPRMAATLTGLAGTSMAKRNFDEAEPLLRRALDIHRSAYGAVHPDVAKSLNNLGYVLSQKGDLEATEVLYREALALNIKLHGDEHPVTSDVYSNLGFLLQRKGNLEEGEQLLRKAIEIKRKVQGENHPSLSFPMNNLALLLWDKGDYDGAEANFRAALEVRRKSLRADHPNVAFSMNSLAAVLYDKGNLKEAEPLLRRALEIRRKSFPEGHSDIGASLTALGQLLTDKGDLKAAEPMLREGLEIVRRAQSKDDLQIASAESALGGCLVALRRYEEAEPLLVNSYSRLKDGYSQQDRRLRRVIGRLITLYESRGMPEVAAQYRSAPTRLN